MPAVMPSQIVKIIDKLYPTAANGKGGPLSANDRFAIQSIVDLTEKVPEALISVSDADYAELIVAVSWMREHLAHWARNPEARYLQFDTILSVRRVMVACPDQFPPPSVLRLSFIDDDELRDSIRSDLGATRRALENAEWKAATVLAGATIEALLHWILSRDFGNNIADALRASGLQTSHSLDKWVLGEFIPVAKHLNVIRTDTVTAAMLAKDYRNLIHPGRSARIGYRCDRGTAYSAIGALERVVADIETYCTNETADA